MIQIWAADVSSLMEEKSRKKYFELLSEDPVLGPERQQKAAKLMRRENISQSIGAGILLIRMRREYGLKDGFLYNLSHSGRYALCAVEDGSGAVCTKLGCDIEMVKAYRGTVARRFFTESEYRFIEGIPRGKEQAEMFYRYWVLKESFIKAVRKGMKLPLDTFEIRMNEKGPVLLRQPEEIPGEFFYREYHEEGIPAKIAVCADRDTFAPEIIKIQL